MSWALALLIAAQPEIVGFEAQHAPESVTFVLQGTAPPSFSAQHDEEKQRLIIDWAGARLRPGLEPPLHPWLRTVRLLERRVESERSVRIVLGLGTERAFQLRARKNAIQVVFPGPPPPRTEPPEQLSLKLEVDRETTVEVPRSREVEASTVPEFADEDGQEQVQLALPPIDVSPEVQAALDRAAAAERAEAERRRAERRAREEAERREAARLAEARRATEAESAARLAEEKEAEKARAAARRTEPAAPADQAPLASWSPPPPQVLASTEVSEEVKPEGVEPSRRGPPLPSDDSKSAPTPAEEAEEKRAPSEAESESESESEVDSARPERPAIQIPPERATMTYIGFRVRGRISRVFVRLDRDAAFRTEQSPGRLRVVLPNTRVDVANNERPLDTSYFESPVTWEGDHRARANGGGNSPPKLRSLDDQEDWDDPGDRLRAPRVI